MTRLIAGSAIIAALAVAVPLSVAHAGGGQKEGHGGGGHGMHGGKGGHKSGRHHGGRGEAKIRLQKALDRFDLNGDGSISQDEVDQVRADRLKSFDKDGDGALSLEEYEALWLDTMHKRMVRAFQKHDRDGDGSVTVDEFTETTRFMVLRRDRNEDGVLNKDDLKHKGRHGKGHGKRREQRRKQEGKSE